MINIFLWKNEKNYPYGDRLMFISVHGHRLQQKVLINFIF